jgi:endo-1,4-beta-mannosidase
MRNPYAEAEIIEAQIYFLMELTNAVSGHPALFSWDLGNEPSLWSVSPDNFAAELWLQAMTETLKERDDRLPVTLSFHVSDLGRRQGLTLGMAANYLDYLSINVQPQRVSWTEDSFSAVLPSFLASVTGWLGKGPVMVQEFGLATKTTLPVPRGFTWDSTSEQLLVSEEDAALFAEDALLHLRRSRFMGAFCKSFGDYHPSIWKWPPLDKHINERFSGLVRYDGSPKVAASVFTSEFKSYEKERISSQWLDVSLQEYYRDPDEHLRRLFGRFREYYSVA